VFITALAHFVSVNANKQLDVPPKGIGLRSNVQLLEALLNPL